MQELKRCEKAALEATKVQGKIYLIFPVLKAKLKDAYNDFNLVYAQPTGRPTEERIIAKELSDLIEKVGVRKVVFHSLRHLSTSVKLKVSGGDVKAVQAWQRLSESTA